MKPFPTFLFGVVFLGLTLGLLVFGQSVLHPEKNLVVQADEASQRVHSLLGKKDTLTTEVATLDAKITAEKATYTDKKNLFNTIRKDRTSTDNELATLQSEEQKISRENLALKKEVLNLQGQLR